ncbi:SnoaL-like protein [Algoriphagus boseongensis]|uniref:histidine kinase n=2 Tax=Algoriphagus boseongensis TaxID=1442587 RepID=A0A4R6T446_9BACT|nr:ATP-binding protein [Algoriphagus boseongensis]TDQ17033.1 SnoaL-like protein [Algoriphagus boseongensis]
MKTGLEGDNPGLIKKLVDERVMGFGTAIDEKVIGSQGLISLIETQKKQAEGLDISWRHEPMDRFISDDENTAVFADDIFLIVKTESEELEMYMRFSTVLNYSNTEWKVIHWHGSKPEEVESDKDTWGIENWKQKAEELERLVAEKTADLVEKNRELEIEAALERVRSMTMAMHSSTDIGACILKMFEELTFLGVDEGTRFGIGILNHNNENNQLWTARRDGEEVKMHIGNLDMTSHPLLKKARKAWKEQVPFHQYVLEGQDLMDYYQMLNNAPDYKIHIPLEKLPKKEIQHCFIFEHGFFYAFSPNEFNPELIQITQRFSSQFSQTYRRYLDLQKAEQQARQAQIEVAVERVRAQSMAMHHPDDLNNVNKELLAQLKWLQIQGLSGVTFYLVGQDGWVKAWDFSSPGNIGDQTSYTIHFDYTKYEMLGFPFKTLLQTDLDYFVADYPLEKLKKAVWEFEEIDKAIANILKEALSTGALTHQWTACARISNGLLGVDLVDSPNEDTKAIVLKMAGAFNQAYTRFLDLQKAEAQAREAQIEAALERVRSRSMAMHKSEELKEVIQLLFEQFRLLNFKIDSAQFDPNYKDNDDLNLWAAAPGQPYSILLNIPYVDSPLFNSIKEAKKRGLSFITQKLSYEDKNQFFRHFFQHIKNIPAARQKLIFDSPGMYRAVVFMENVSLAIQNYSNTPYSEEENEVLKRFGKTFEQVYTRFLDLQRAEAQAREAEIELALERVRARTMAMHKSEELAETAAVLFEQLRILGNTPERINLGIFKEEENLIEWWITTQDGHLIEKSFITKFQDHQVLKGMFKAWKEKKKSDVINLKGDEVKDWVQYITTVLGMPVNPELVKEQRFLSSAYFSQGLIGTTTSTPLPEETISLLERFASVFQQTYTRFLDLQRAEKQTREARIEAALEKIRSRTMGMQSSAELPEVANLLFLEIQALGIPAWSCGYNILAEDKKTATCCMSSEGTLQTPFQLRLWGEASFDEMRKFILSDNTMLVQEVGGKALEEHYTHMKSFPDLKPTFDEIERLGLSLPTYQINHLCKFNQGFILFITYEQVPEAYDIFKRFTKVFDQTYTRFLDLQKAEAQARESQIEAALERVRAQAMAMHRTEDLGKTIRSFYEQLSGLIQSKIVRCGAGLLTKNHTMAIMSTASQNAAGETYNVKGSIDMSGNPLLKETYSHWLRQEEYHGVLRGNEIKTYYQYLTNQIAIPNNNQGDELHLYFPMFSEGSIYLVTTQEVPEEELKVFRRFSSTISLAYRRFNDLKKAEEQAREAQIEASLERVRSRTLAMQKSDELAETAAILFQQLIQLGIEPNRLYIGIIKDNSSETEFWTTEEDGSKISTAYTTDLLNNASFTKMYEGWRRKEKSTVVDIQGKELKEYIDYLTSLNIPFKDGKKQTRRIQYLAYFAKGFIGMASPDEQPRESMEILERFAYAFNLTFTRFNDLKVAEAQARQAQIEVALERVRARALAMQEPEELKEVAKVLRQEMGTLGVEELETSSIYIHDPGSDLSECWYAIKDIRKGKTKLVSDHFALNLSATWVGRKMLDLFESSETKSSIVMTGKNRLEWIRYCEENSKPLQGYYGEDIPDRTYHLYKFSHGAIGAASAGEISQESWDLLKRAATAFSLAYSRFKDLTQARIDLLKLKEEKQRAETALTELKAAQSQLVQAEKMASLGELTAGIAHEIQNPLNFVNNFSEVSAELIDEAQGEIEKGDLEEIKFILQDLKDNLTKINHHGKRAGSIVKGMLEHSRKSEGKKELTDLNQLADECLRLSFHGLRAKDKSFSADFKTEFDPNLPKLEVVTQDMGRVLLNLINNAFYAVNEKAKDNREGFKPQIIVSTQLSGAEIEISVKDNGNGVPDSIKDKIFQPFFTTKPTGSGTGLGLSLSYDIVKAHGGELKLETKVGEGTDFQILLPFNPTEK